MERWSLNNHSIEVEHYITDKDIRESIFDKIQARSGFKYDDRNIVIPRHFIRVIGVEDEESDYYNYLFDFKEKLAKLDGLFLFINEGLDISIPSKFRLDLDRSWSELMFERNLTPNTVYQKLEERKLLVEFPNKSTSHQIRKTFMDILKYYFEVKRVREVNEELKSFVYQFTHWINTYLKELFLNYDYTQNNPKVLAYGQITENEVLFLSYLSLLGCDILYFNPEVEQFFGVHAGGLSTRVDFNRKLKKKPFPSKKIVGRASTLTYEASQEINEMLSAGNGFYRNWALIDYPTHAVTLRTTYDEIFRILPEVAQVRPEWNFQNGMVNIPNIFAKITGISEDDRDYWNKIRSLLSNKHTLLFNDSAVTNVLNKSISYYFDLLKEVSPNELFNHQLLLESPKWPYSSLPLGIQKNIALEIEEMIKQQELTNSKLITKDIVKMIVENANSGIPYINSNQQTDVIYNKLNEGVSFKIGNLNQDTINNAYILGSCLELSEMILKTLQVFDYPKEVPKLIVFNSGNRTLLFEEAIVIRLMSRLGLDVIIYNPSGKNDIELYIDPQSQIYDIHLLENRQFDLRFFENKKERKFWFARFFN